MNIEELMKPYFDKINEIDNYKSMNKSYLEQKEIIALRLERIRDYKKSEIDEYLQNEFLNKPNFLGYEAVKKDLENEYLLKEQSLEKQIKDLEIEIENNENKIRKFYNDNVDIREFVEIKEEIRKGLISSQKEAKITLEEIQLKYDVLMFRLSNFKYVYDENHIVQNGEEYKRLFDESHKLIDERKLIEKQLNQIEEYLSLTELTSKEIETLMRSMTPIEKEEYDRRKGLNVVEQTEELEKIIEGLEDIEESVEEETKEELNIEEYDENVDYESLSKADEYEEESLTNEELIRESADELINDVYNDIINSAKELNVVEGNMIGLPSESYLSESDLNQAVKKYYKKNKGRTYTVKGIKEELIITKDSIKNFKKALKKCVAIKLTREGKATSYDLKRVFVQKEMEEIENQAQQPEELIEEEIYSTNPSGRYIEEQSFINALPNLFQVKRESWIEKMVAKMKSKKQARKENKNADYDYGFYPEEEMYIEEEVYDYDEPVKTR